jgi:hypothetical protein
MDIFLCTTNKREAFSGGGDRDNVQRVGGKATASYAGGNTTVSQMCTRARAGAVL